MSDVESHTDAAENSSAARMFESINERLAMRPTVAAVAELADLAELALRALHAIGASADSAARAACAAPELEGREAAVRALDVIADEATETLKLIAAGGGVQ